MLLASLPHRVLSRRLAVVLALIPLATAIRSAPAARAPSVHRASPPSEVSFFHQVKPILAARCQGCHQPANMGGKLVLTTFAGFLKGGASGPGFVPGHPEKSTVMAYITGGDPPRMPKNATTPLLPEQIDLIRRWIRAGAHDDTPAIQDSISQDRPPVYTRPPVVSALAFSPDGSMLAVSGYREVLLHRADGSGLLARLVGRAPYIESLVFSPDGASLFAAGGTPAEGGEIQIWDVKSRKLTRSINATTDTVFGASLSPDGKKIAVGGADDSVRVYNVADGSQLIKFDNHSDWVFGTTFALDSKHLLSVSRDQAIKLILLEGPTGSFVDDINTHHSALRCVVRLPKEDKVLCAGDDGILRLYQVYRTTARTMNQEDHNLLKEYPPLPSTITALAVSPDGARAAVGDLAGNLRIFNVADAKLLVSLQTYNGGIFALAFHPGGAVLAAAGFDGRVRLYSSAGQLLHQFIPVPILRSKNSRTQQASTSGATKLRRHPLN